MLANVFTKGHIRCQTRDRSDSAQDSDGDVQEERKRQLQISAAESEFKIIRQGGECCPCSNTRNSCF